MLFNRLGVYQDVVQVDYYYPFHNELVEDVVHHGLEGGWAVSQTEKHHEGFEEAAVGAESSFPLISFLHPDIIEPPPHVEFSEVLCSAQLLNEFRDEWERVLVFDRHGIERAVVLDETK